MQTQTLPALTTASHLVHQLAMPYTPNLSNPCRKGGTAAGGTKGA